MESVSRKKVAVIETVSCLNAALHKQASNPRLGQRFLVRAYLLSVAFLTAFEVSLITCLILHWHCLASSVHDLFFGRFFFKRMMRCFTVVLVWFCCVVMIARIRWNESIMIVIY